MFFKRKRGWELPESMATDESVFLQRRKLLKTMGTGSILMAAAVPGGQALAKAAANAGDPTADLYPGTRNEKFVMDRPLSAEKDVLTFNNFYEFGSHKSISEAAQKLKIRPWEIKIDGMVENEIVTGFDDLIRKMPIEERLYRHRCVEAWSMAVPWSGFPFRALVDFAKPLSKAKYVRMETLEDKETMPGLRQFWYPWPYTEGLTIEEATNDLAFIATGLYGKPMPKQNGAPLRLAVPWKYGFKSTKSIVRFTFTDKRPISYWEATAKSEYGFWANVNPEVPHRRWSQATERVLGSRKRVPTLMYNGYGEFVADMYKNMKGEKLFM
ncbi:MAG: sulfoxide reductase catalytic subunit YedY [Alphaproteobacteria bacterium]|jgi:sulfoxide reductase catalytic subunit YedY